MAAKESGLECTCMNSDNFTVLVSEGSRRHWVSMCGHHIQNDWVTRAMRLHQTLWYAWTFFCGNYSDNSEAFGGWCNECSTNKSMAKMLQRWSRIYWMWPMFWKACNKKNTWECWTLPATINTDQQLTVQEREADWGIPKTTASETLMQDVGMKCIEEKFILQPLLPKRRNTLRHLGELHVVPGNYFEGDWGVLVSCTTFLVSCIFFNKCLSFSYHMAEYFLDRPHISYITMWPSNPSARYLPKKLENIYAQRYMSPHVHCSTIHNGQDTKKNAFL